MRPASIVLFERLYIYSLAISLCQLVVAVEHMTVRKLASALVAGELLYFILVISLTLMVSRRRNSPAGWVLLLLFLLVLPETVLHLLSGKVVLLTALAAIAQIFQAIGLYLLFTPEARAWLARRAPL